MRNVRISRLLPALFVLMVVLGALQGAIAFRSLSAMTGHIERIGTDRMPQMNTILQLSHAFSELNATYSEHLLSMDPDEIGRIEGRIKERTDAFAGMVDSYAAANGGDAATLAEIDGIKATLKTYVEDSAKLIQFSAIAAKGPALDVYKGPMQASADAITASLNDLVARTQKVTDETILAARGEEDTAFALTWASLTAAMGLAIAAIFLVNRRVVTPLNGLAGAMKRLAAGDTAVTIPHAGRTDEIGEMAGTVAVFRDNAADRQRLERQSEDDRRRTEAERQAREAERTRDSGRVQEAVASLADALGKLAGGDMTCRIEKPFDGDLDRLREDFNASVSRLADALREVGENARAIDAGASQIRAAADDLSRRTEQQAASVEETAAALEEVTTTVKDSTKRAEEAGALVARTRSGAEKSGEIVRRAVAAMQEIEKSSSEITSIIGVIDEIAFQTNLLALNAGVEAARAGEAGKGFAVVAQEVRELAQRSAKAAKEIKTLINTSGEQVRSGVSLVGDTGRSLQTIVAEVQEINSHVEAIVEAAREQSAGLQEINTAVNAMDQGTQKNAAMVEETTAASHGLASEVQALNALIGRFNVGGSLASGRTVHAPHLHIVPATTPAPPVAPATEAKVARKSPGQWNIKPANPASRPVTSPALALSEKLAGALGVRQDKGNDGDWEEF
ncbi:HAMP domain-containing methyl-accepting chemotaxis protein [Shinella zoogloeoides]|uniref:HAMP domain-containing methyl-accepting chemotaxis protein n=1 Tax=Shinella zoogloeoides TaxID=352475 RepID=UPI00273E43AB|nr:methyl-accepting chemotaxis protein [Shinella zoogloeoides]WLR92603.1 methyl-accepting chemotaxis protein [Shinella zoogloeoides]